jgi:hypothetical protein
MTASPDRFGRSTGRWDHVNHSLLFLEIAALNGPGGTAGDREVARAPLHRVVRNAFAESDIPWGDCRHAERHDGLLVVVPPSVTTWAIVDRLIPHIQKGVRRYNREAAPVRIQLRASLHVGHVTAGAEGLSGQAIAAAARLLNSPELLRSNDDLAVMVSAQVYETVIRNASGFADPTRYLEIRTEESNAWLFAPELRNHPRYWTN